MTDKSGKLSVNTLENYKESMVSHIAGDDVISFEEKKDIERKTNGHCVQLGRILKLGE